MTNTAAGGDPEKVDELRSFRLPGAVIGGGERLFVIQSGEIHLVKGFLHILPGGGGQTGATHADDVQTTNLIGVRCHGVGRHVLTDRGQSFDHAEIADSHKLVKGGAAAEKGAVPQNDMSTKEAMIGQDVAVADDGVVTDMTAHHEVIVLADEGDAALFATAMNGDVFPQDVA